MKGKSTFTKAEAIAIEMLIAQKCKAPAHKQKAIREKIRFLGFYASDFGIRRAYTVEDFRRVAKIVNPIKKEQPIHNTPESISFVSIINEVLHEIRQVNDSNAIEIDFSTDILLQLGRLGFEGFLPISAVMNDFEKIPKQKGIYMILHLGKEYAFQEKNTGCRFKGEDPKVSIAELESNWVEGSKVLYIGKAGSLNGEATLYSRLKQFFRFGRGEEVGHLAESYIWQMQNPLDLVVCWKELTEVEPALIERKLIKASTVHYGKCPFANLKD